MTRGDDSYVDLYERAILANNLNAKLFVSIHNNSFNGSAYGTETLYYSPSSGSSKTIAAVIQAKLINTLGSYDRGIVSRPNLVVLNTTKMPAVLTEVGFMDNPDEKAKLMSDDYKQKAAQAICDGIIASLGNL
jgi:N-acetylmuramoyl-L-alanine amidase